jgi:homospermidine synthase
MKKEKKTDEMKLYRELASNRSIRDAKVLIIGFGGLAKAALELLPICKFLPKSLISSLVIIEPKTLMRKSLLPTSVASEEYTRYDFLDYYENITHIPVALTKSNIDDIMHRVLPGKALILDASVSVDGIAVMKHAARYGSAYVNTSMENWDTENMVRLATNQDDLHTRTLHYQYHRAIKLFRPFSSDGLCTLPTMIFDHGANPGLISHMAKVGIEDMNQFIFHHHPNSSSCNNHSSSSSCTDSLCGVIQKRKFKQMSRNLGIHTIHVAELDTQDFNADMKAHENKKAFYNTWSIPGLIVEALDPSQIGYGSFPEELPKQIQPLLSKKSNQKEKNKNSDENEAIQFSDTTHYSDEIERNDSCNQDCSENFLLSTRDSKDQGDIWDNILFLRKHGLDVTTSTLVISPTKELIKITGFIIPHGESNTLSTYLSSCFPTFYVPSVYYVYRPSLPAVRSLYRLKKEIKTSKVDAENRLEHTRVLDQGDLNTTKGFDSIGAFIQTKEHGNWWTGTILTAKDVQAFGVRYAGPTECQVAISFLAGARYAMENPGLGLCNPEHLCSRTIFNWCRPYLGKVISRFVY